MPSVDHIPSCNEGEVVERQIAETGCVMLFVQSKLNARVVNREQFVLSCSLHSVQKHLYRDLYTVRG